MVSASVRMGPLPPCSGPAMPVTSRIFCCISGGCSAAMACKSAWPIHESSMCMPPTHRHEDHVASIQPHCSGDGGHDGACHDVGPVPVGWPRGQLSDGATLFRDGHPVGRAVLGVLSAPCVSVRGDLPPRGDEVVA